MRVDHVAWIPVGTGTPKEIIKALQREDIPNDGNVSVTKIENDYYVDDIIVRSSVKIEWTTDE